MTVINSNSAALRAQNGTRLANQMLQTAMARLSSGNRINTRPTTPRASPSRTR